MDFPHQMSTDDFFYDDFMMLGYSGLKPVFGTACAPNCLKVVKTASNCLKVIPV